VSLSRSPRDAVALLRRHLKPARVDAKQVRAWLDDWPLDYREICLEFLRLAGRNGVGINPDVGNGYRSEALPTSPPMSRPFAREEQVPATP
jgi:hypothetical protein